MRQPVVNSMSLSINAQGRDSKKKVNNQSSSFKLVNEVLTNC